MNNVMFGYVDMMFSILIIFVVIWMVVGFVWCVWDIKWIFDKGGEMIGFDVFLFFVVVIYGFVYIVFSLLIWLLMKVDGFVLFKGKKFKEIKD